MSEELLQRNLIKNPEKIGTWNFYNIGSTNINALKEAGIIRSIDYGDIALKKVDAIITKQKEVIAIVEYKQPRQFNTKNKKNEAVLQEIEVAKKLKTKLIIATDTQETLWINVTTGNSVKDENGNEFKYFFNPKDNNLQKIIIEILQSVNEKNDKILPKKLVNPTDLAKQIWQDVWSVSGAVPENCLYTFVELFIFKYLSDLNILTGTYSFNSLMDMYKRDEDNVVLQHYADIIRPKIKKLFPENPIDKTTIINGTIFVSKDQRAVDGYGTVFKKVLEKFKNYGKLENIDHDFKSKLFESFLKESISKKNWGQFFTPLKVVRAINEMAEGELREGMKICDPACGVGKFPLEIIKDKLDKLFTIESGKIHQKIKIIGFDKGFDKDEQKTIILAKANMLIYFCELIKDNVGLTKEFANIFNESFVLKTNSILGTLSEPTENEYDLILTNPPYVTSGSSNLKEEIVKNIKLKNYYKVNAMGVEGLFMEWIIKALKPNGKAFIIIPDGLLYRQDELRQFILNNCYIEAIISLPMKTFFSTQKKTYILVITKKNDISKNQIDPVFTYLVSEIGESRDINRLEIEQDDLQEAVNLYNAFKGSKKYFADINQDCRCKIVPFEWFMQNVNQSWVIENLWKLEHLIKFGFKKGDNTLNINEFPLYLFNIIENVVSLQNQIDTKNIETCEYKQINIMDENYFEVVKGSIGMKKTEYSKFDSKDINDIPVFTAALLPVAHFKESSIRKKPNIASFEYPHISFANDGDGTAGTNIILHAGKYYINTSRFAFRVIASNISSDYIFFAIKDIKQKYGFDFTHKATIENIKKILISIPVDSTGKFDMQKQKEIAEQYRKVEEIKKSIKTELEKIENIKVDVEV